MTDQQFFKRYRMEIHLNDVTLPLVTLPQGYFWRAWCDTDLERHALTKYRSFRDEIDSEVFSCLGEYYGCLKLMSDISSQDKFLACATWLITSAGEDRFPEDCGTIQGIGVSDRLGSIQNIGVVPEHRGIGLGRALIVKSLQGFRESGIDRVVLEVTASNRAAVDLYRSLGFHVVRTMYRVVPVEESAY